ncbi:MAG: hypothetical protein ACLP3C_15670 [Mycobacterium sp.]|uniref:hypothetical protein n=1 Tax=Mycobacterium sp. TaxID=1785 RepID=UPI003F98F481
MPLTPSERRQRASIAGTTGWLNTEDRSARARHMVRGNYEKYYRATNPNLPDAERAKLAETAWRLHLQRMAFRSAVARRERKEAREREAQARREARQAEQLRDGDVA